eukprot:6990572-Pyramimonas_sp.AAC.2
MDDKKRAIVSRLLQRRCVEENMGISWEDINIKRTKGRKPFLANEVRNSIAHSAGDIRAFLPPAVQAFGLSTLPNVDPSSWGIVCRPTANVHPTLTSTCPTRAITSCSHQSR